MMQEKREMLNIAAILTVSMSSRCRQLISAIIIATVSTSGAAARRGCPQRARAMLRTVSEVRARIGRCFISTNASASVNEAGATSQRCGEAVVADAKDFIDFWGRRVECSREACRGERSRGPFIGTPYRKKKGGTRAGLTSLTPQPRRQGAG